MGEAKRKVRSQADLIASEPPCIYCKNRPETVEHMPPITMFRKRARPRGLEFASCALCNQGTRGADAVASFFSRLHLDYGSGDWQSKEADTLKPILARYAPGVLQEFTEHGKELHLRIRGVIRPMVGIRANPLLSANLTVFASKWGMASYREHVGQALPTNGAVYSRWYLNAGPAQQEYDAAMNMMPTFGTLRQGQFQVHDQFAYRFNSDERTITATFAKFHQGLYILTIATAEPDRYLHLAPPSQTSAIVAPGELNELLK